MVYLRLAYLGAGVFVGTATSKLGLTAGSAITKNADLSDIIKESKHSDPNVDNIPSPDEPNFTVNSPTPLGTEDGVPLLDLINSILSLNVLELLLIILIIIIVNNNNLS